MTHPLLKTIWNRLDSFNESLNRQAIQIDLTPGLKSDLIKAVFFSEYIASGITRNPGVFKDLMDSKDLFTPYSKKTYGTKLAKKISKDMDAAGVKEILLQTKLYETLRIAWRDLTGAAQLKETPWRSFQSCRCHCCRSHGRYLC